MVDSCNEESAVLNHAVTIESPIRRIRNRKRRWSGEGINASPVSVLSSPTPQQILHTTKRRRWSPHILRQDDITLVSSPSPGKIFLAQQNTRKLRRRSLKPHAANRCPFFNASEIAAIIGLHKHGVPLHALVRCWRRYDCASLRKWEQETGGVNLPELTFARHANSQVRDAVRTAVAEGDGELKPAAEASIMKAIQENAPSNVWKTLREEALGRARCGRGTRLEHAGLAAYEKSFGRVVVRRNQDSFRQQFGAGVSAFTVSGRVDGFEMFNGDRWVVEHKRRQRRLFEEVPQYEEVQCQVYMVLTGTTCCRWVQTLGQDVDVRSLARCNLRWSCIRERLRATAILLRRLCSGAAVPAVSELEAMQRDCWAAASPWPSGPAPVPKKNALHEISSMSASTDECRHQVSCADCTVVSNDSSPVLAMDASARQSLQIIQSDTLCADSLPNPCVSDLNDQGDANMIEAEGDAPFLTSIAQQAELIKHIDNSEIPPTMPDEENGTILDESPSACPEIGSQWETAPTEVDESETELTLNEQCSTS